VVQSANPQDQPWFAKLFDVNRASLGNVSGGTVFWRWLQSKQPNERILVIRPVAFVHYRIKRDGMRVVYEIAVAASAQRQGLARVLMDRVGRPVTLKTNADNEPSNRFYERLGFAVVAHVNTRDGKLMNVYQGW
jgi:ribosomal protein S18 acetylase RimI-like enzyme